jgi:hypothetical protein
MNERRDAKATLIVDPNESIVARFLKTECIYTPFETDYIILSDLEEAYQIFCQNFLDASSTQESIVGSAALAEFGTSLSSSVPVEYIQGMMNGSLGDDSKNQDLNLVRRPYYYKNQVIPWRERAKIRLRAIYKTLFNSHGVVVQGCIVIINIIMLIAIPCPYIYLFYTLVLEKTQIQADFHGLYYDITRLLNPSQNQPWWSEVPNTEIFFYA